MKLIKAYTGAELFVGDVLETFRGESVQLISMTEPHSINSTGRVYVEFEDGCRGEYFPSIIGAQWVAS